MSEQLKIFQAKGGIPADGVWGPQTFRAGMTHFGLSKVRAVHFFANTAHETGNFMVFSENLNYSADGLVRTWPGRFGPGKADPNAYAHKPEAIANLVYANRMGNGNEASGDGWKYRGRGAIQTTGMAAYQQLADALGRPDVVTNPDIVGAELAFESAKVFFDKNGIWALCDRGLDTNNIRAVRKVLNGGYIGVDDVIARANKYAAWA